MKEFKVGDVIKSSFRGKKYICVIRAVKPAALGVEVISDKFTGHNLDGIIKNKQGWWVFRSYCSGVEIIEKQSENGFTTGDRVRVKEEVGCNAVKNAEGTVIDSNGKSIGIMFDPIYDINGHSLSLSDIETCQGWMVYYKKVERIKGTDAEIPADNPVKPIEIKEDQSSDTDKGFIEFMTFIKQVPEQYIYVARDTDGKLFAYIDKPKIDFGGLQYYGEKFKRINNDLFPKLTFKDGALKIREVKGDE